MQSEPASYRHLKALVFNDRSPPPMAIGTQPELRMIDLELLVVDDRYQRTIGKNGRPSIQAILSKFDWRKFGVVIVTPVTGCNGEELYAIIDGQHRATAAYMHPAITHVPCLVLNVTPEEAASIFASVNGQITAITAQQLFKARSMAGEPSAKMLQKVLDAAGVRILPYKTPAMPYKKGDTLAIGTLERCLRAYGPEVLTTALQAITQTGTGNVGCITATAIRVLCEMVRRAPEWLESPTALFELMDEINLQQALLDAVSEAKRDKKPQHIVLLQTLPARMGVSLRSLVDVKNVAVPPTRVLSISKRMAKG